MKKKVSSGIYKFVKFWVWYFYPKMKLQGAYHIPKGPAVIVGNHTQMNGPIASELYLPGTHYTWCISEMMEKELVPEYAFTDFWSKKPAITHPFYKWLAKMIAPLSEIIFTNANTIPVYKDKRILETFDQSVDRLKEGAKIVIFPECYEEHNNIVHEFQRGFVDVAKKYYRATKEEIPFVPMYVCPDLKRLVFGKPVYFDHNAKMKEEEERICKELMDSISEMAYKLPVHTVVPYPNIPKKEYGKNK